MVRPVCAIFLFSCNQAPVFKQHTRCPFSSKIIRCQRSAGLFNSPQFLPSSLIVHGAIERRVQESAKSDLNTIRDQLCAIFEKSPTIFSYLIPPQGCQG